MKVLLNGTPAGYWSKGDDSPINTDFLRTEVLVDVLNGCKANCKGCFIPRRNVNPYLGNFVVKVILYDWHTYTPLEGHIL